ncbi:hypothetical protein ACFX2I_024772 [Malus domestica]
MANSQFIASSFANPRRLRICSDQYIPRWANPFPLPQPGKDPTVVEKALDPLPWSMGLLGMFGQHLEARLIKWKLGLLCKNGVKDKLYLYHYARGWFALEFMDADDLDFVFNNRP